MNRPIIISTWSFGERGNAMAWPILATGGSATDAVECACMTVEADPEVDSVGYGGLPDASGEVSLDAAIMLSPSRCGSVTFVRKFLHVSSLARRVMERSAHIMLSGEGAERFALEQGFVEQNLVSDDARTKWLRWKDDPNRNASDQARDHAHGMRPIDAATSGRLFGSAHDTIGVLALDAAGTLAGACSTSGTPFKSPGRVGDSPIVGHGLYVLPSVGAVTATGTGELIMGVCGSFAIVEAIRRGAAPVEAIRDVLIRTESHFVLRPQDQVAYIALDPDGSFASGSLRGGFKIAVRDSSKDGVFDPDFVLRGD